MKDVNPLSFCCKYFHTEETILLMFPEQIIPFTNSFPLYILFSLLGIYSLPMYYLIPIQMAFYPWLPGKELFNPFSVLPKHLVYVSTSRA